MKRPVWTVVLLLAALPARGAEKLSVAQLKDLLVSSHQAGKSDADVAAKLQNVELTEELTKSTMNSLAPEVPGQLTTEQLFVLEIRSAALPPPAADLPGAPAPDAAAQKTMLDKAADYATGTYSQMPPVTATKEIRRFQDGAEASTPALAAKNNANFAPRITPIRYTSSDETRATLRNGAEQDAAPDQKTTWGLNGMILLQGPIPALPAVLQDAQQAGRIGWLRWETVNGKQAAVFSFAVDKKKSHYAVNYCCFPEVSQTGEIAMRGTETPGGAGNYQTADQWKPWKATVQYHGEIFIDPETGAVVRLISQVDFKGSDPVKTEMQRIDFGSEKVGDQTVMAPVQMLIDTAEQPYPDSPSGRFIVRHTLFVADYKDYQTAN